MRAIALRAFPMCLVFTAMSAAICGSGAVARAEEDAQALLDQATEAKANADSVEELSRVAKLCREAISRGLDPVNTDFARQMLGATLTQRAELFYGEIFDRPRPSPRWKQYRAVALADLEESLDISSDNAEAHFMLARLQALPDGDPKAANEALAEAIKLSDKKPSLKAKALVMRAQLSSDPKQRSADLDEARKLAPRSAEVMRSQGQFLLSQKDYDGALKCFDEAIGVNPDQPDNHEARGLALFSLKRYDDAMQSFDKAIDLSPNSPLVYTHRARIKAIKEDYTAAISELNNALQLAPELEPALLLRARVYQQMGLTNRALSDVADVLEREPKNSQALQFHAALLAGSGKLDEAIEDLESLRQSDPKDSELLLQLAMFYTLDQKPQKALEAFAAVIKEDPKNWMAFRGRGDTYLGLGKQADAVADYEAALKFDPENSGVLNNLAWLLATSPDAKLRNGRRAVELATSACKLTDYKQAHILSTLAAAHAEAGDFKTAIEWSTKAVDLGEGKVKDQLRQELSSYQLKKPWRETTPASADDDKSAQKSGDSQGEKSSDAAANSQRAKR